MKFCNKQGGIGGRSSFGQKISVATPGITFPGERVICVQTGSRNHVLHTALSSDTERGRYDRYGETRIYWTQQLRQIQSFTRNLHFAIKRSFSFSRTKERQEDIKEYTQNKIYVENVENYLWELRAGREFNKQKFVIRRYHLFLIIEYFLPKS